MTETESDNEEEDLEEECEEVEEEQDFMGLNNFNSKKVDLLKPSLF